VAPQYFTVAGCPWTVTVSPSAKAGIAGFLCARGGGAIAIPAAERTASAAREDREVAGSIHGSELASSTRFYR